MTNKTAASKDLKKYLILGKISILQLMLIIGAISLTATLAYNF